MRTPFDLLGKQIGQTALGPFGETVAQDGITPDTQYADLRYEPDPARAVERARLGLLGRIAATPCLFEIYADAPTSAEFRACLSKHIAHWHARVAPAQARPAAPGAPFLWIIAAGTPRSLLAELAVAPASRWPAGVYFFGGKVLRVGFVAASKLPRERSTLLVRLMAGGPLLPQAIVELRALPADAHERAVADQILLRWHHALLSKSNRTKQEEEFVVTMYRTWDDAREEGRQEGREAGRQEGREAGRQEGRSEARARDVLTVLRVRGIPVSDAERERVLGETDPDRLERWLERAVSAASLAAVLDEPS